MDVVSTSRKLTTPVPLSPTGDLEEKLDEKTAALIHLQRVTMEQDAVSPVRNSRIAEALGPWASPGGGGAVSGHGVGGSHGAGPIAAALAAAGDEHARGGRASSLMSTRQFKPFDDARAGASPTAEHDGVLLTADEKIVELSRVVDKTLSDREGLLRDLEDVQAEKVQMETLLRDRLEKLVQEEIENRLVRRAPRPHARAG